MSTPSPASATKAIRQAWDNWLETTNNRYTYAAASRIITEAISDAWIHWLRDHPISVPAIIQPPIHAAWEESAGGFRAEVREAVSEAWGYEDHTEAVKSAVRDWLDANRTEILAEVGKAATDLASEANR